MNKKERRKFLIIEGLNALKDKAEKVYERGGISEEGLKRYFEEVNKIKKTIKD
jgi:N-acetylneuraminic acid mutarotase